MDKYTIARRIKTEINFPRGDTFEAIGKAEEWLNKNGYSKGSMQRNAPIAIVKGDCHIAKWRNISQSEHQLIYGVIIPLGENFRNDGAKIILFEPVK